MSPLRKSMPPPAGNVSPSADAAPRHVHQRRRQVDGQHLGTAARQLDREAAGAAAGVQHTAAAQVGRQPVEQRSARMRSRPARTVARMRPTGASLVSCSQALRAVRSK
jgi:hypothetical protein